MHEYTGYDIIGDIHGYATMLRSLLTKLGYRHGGGTWHHGGGRKAVFVGDIIDRGPEQQDAVETVRGMVAAGDALCIMGNHEYNAIQHQLGLRELKGETDPHRKFLTKIGEGSSLYKEYLSWFRQLPLWLDLGEFAVVHACWDPHSMRILHDLGLGEDSRLSDGLHQLAGQGKDKEGNAPDALAWRALEKILKGPELKMEGGSFSDKDGTSRTEIRTRWYKSGFDNYHDLAFMTGPQLDNIPPLPLESGYEAMPPEKPVFIGHYWQDKDEVQEPLSDRVVCVDYSAGADGPLAAYRWNTGDTALSRERFICVPHQEP